MFKAFARVAARSIAIQLEEAAAAARSKQPYVDPTPKIHQYNAASKGKIAGSNVKTIETPIAAPRDSESKVEEQDAGVLPIRGGPEALPEVFDDLPNGAGSGSNVLWSPSTHRVPQKSEASPSDSLNSAKKPSPTNIDPLPKPEPIARIEPTPEPIPEVESAIPSADSPAEPNTLVDTVDPEDVGEK